MLCIFLGKYYRLTFLIQKTEENHAKYYINTFKWKHYSKK